MVGRWLALIFSGLAVLGLAACGQGFQGRSSSAEIWLPWPMADFSYRSQPVLIEGLSDPSHVTGPAAKVYFQAGGGRGGFSGPVAEARLARIGKRYLPLDVPSSEALTAYAVFARLKKFDEQLEISGRLSWPRAVGIQIRIKTPKGRVFSNALYDAQTDSVVLARFDADHLPLALNHGALAHEHFHAHFTAVLKALGHGNLIAGLTIDRKNILVLSGLNEGLADFYGAVFSGDARFAERSFGRRGEERSLSGSLIPFDQWQPQLDKPDDAELIYGMGTSFSRTLYVWGEQLGPDGRKRLLQEVLRVLPLVLRDLVQGAEVGTIQPAGFFERLLSYQMLPVPSEWCAGLKIQLADDGGQKLRGCP